MKPLNLGQILAISTVMSEHSCACRDETNPIIEIRRKLIELSHFVTHLVSDFNNLISLDLSRRDAQLYP